jgi:hypothetical protein
VKYVNARVLLFKTLPDTFVPPSEFGATVADVTAMAAAAGVNAKLSAVPVAATLWTESNGTLE